MAIKTILCLVSLLILSGCKNKDRIEVTEREMVCATSPAGKEVDINGKRVNDLECKSNAPVNYPGYFTRSATLHFSLSEIPSEDRAAIFRAGGGDHPFTVKAIVDRKEAEKTANVVTRIYGIKVVQ